ncbi:MAG: type II secretion system F family protein [bacterium]
MNQNDLEHFYLNLSELLSAGISLPDALKKLQIATKFNETPLAEAQLKLQAGKIASAWEVLNLPRRDGRLLEAGQKGGNLEAICRSLASLYQEWNNMCEKLFFTSLWYFFTGLVACGVGAVFVFLAAGPQTALIVFSLLGGSWFVFSFSSFKNFKRLIMTSSHGKSNLLASLPLLKTVYKHLNLFLLFFQWEIMYSAGINTSKILARLSKDFPQFNPILNITAKKTSQGTSLSELPHFRDIMPATDYNRIVTGEESGKLNETLKQLKDKHRNKLRNLVGNLPRLLLLVFYLLFIPIAFGVIIYFWINYFNRIFSI